MEKILITGGLGQIGTELSQKLISIYGHDNVITSDIKAPADNSFKGNFEKLDIMDKFSIERLIDKYQITQIYHLAAILSATGEQNPWLCWNINMNGTINIIEQSIKHKISRIFIPSSIAVWGKGVPIDNTPQDSVLLPTTMYGVTKVAGEVLGEYYVQKHGLDIRGLRYPGIISSETLPGGGTTDYAVEIFYEAVKHKKYTCFLKEDTMLPMMYMPDCIKCTIDIMEADFARLENHTNFNVAAASFTPKQLAEEIKKHIPEFEIDYKVDFRQAIADSWPNTIDDSEARKQWDWKPDFNLQMMTKDMIEKLTSKWEKGLL